MTREEAAHVVRREWDAQGECRSCGWHRALYEVEPIEVDGEDLKNGYVWFPCGNDAGESMAHRGVTVYLNGSGP